MKETQIKKLFQQVSQLKVGVIGDYALDVYYQLHKKTGEISVETGKEVYHGKNISASLGAAGNVVQNLHDFGVRKLQVFGVTGQDIFGREMRHLMHQYRVDTSNLLDEKSWETCVYSKPLLETEEDHRIDFGSQNKLEETVRELLLSKLEAALPHLDVLIINRQFLHPLLDKEFLVWISKIHKDYPKCRFFADIRHGGHLIRGITLKINAEEAANILQKSIPDEGDLKGCEQIGLELADFTKGPVLMTRGEFGLIFIDQGRMTVEEGIKTEGAVDPVGAGDTVISAFSTAMSTGIAVQEAMHIANMAAAVTVKKLNQTGTASPEEIISLHRILQ